MTGEGFAARRSKKIVDQDIFSMARRADEMHFRDQPALRGRGNSCAGAAIEVLANKVRRTARRRPRLYTSPLQLPTNCSTGCTATAQQDRGAIKMPRRGVLGEHQISAQRQHQI